MNKSWANACVTGYEIKVTRADFIGDNKWPAYLPLCNQFYFVAPKGIIDPSELSQDAGLLVVAGEGSGTRLLTKKKAPYRQVVIPEDLYRYILMCRVKVAPEDAMETTVQFYDLKLHAEIAITGERYSTTHRHRLSQYGLWMRVSCRSLSLGRDTTSALRGAPPQPFIMCCV